LIADDLELGIYWRPHTKLREVTDMFSIRHSVAVGVFIACFSGLALAQGGATGAITGTVQDTLGAVLSGAKVDIVSEATGQAERHLTTDSSGNFNATLLPVSSYTVQVSAPGFATTKFPGILVNITETTRITAKAALRLRTFPWRPGIFNSC
jgi:hypothetical protein